MQFVQAFRVSILNISRVCLHWTRNDVLRNGRGRERNFIEIGFDAMVSRDSLVRWVKMIFNDATISRLSSSISNELSLGCHPSESWTLSQFIFVHQRTLYTLFQDVFTYPCASWPFGHPRSHWPANYRHGSRARCVFLKRRYPLREIPISVARPFPFIPASGMAWPSSEMEFLSKIDLDSMRLQSSCGNARLLISRPIITRPVRFSRDVARVNCLLEGEGRFVDRLSKEYR